MCSASAEATGRLAAGPGPGLKEGAGLVGKVAWALLPCPTPFPREGGKSSSIQEILKSVLDPESTLKTFFEYN